MINHTSPLHNTIRKVMYTQILRGLDVQMSKNILQKQNISGFQIKGTCHYCVEPKSAYIKRTPRDLDLVALGKFSPNESIESVLSDTLTGAANSYGINVKSVITEQKSIGSRLANFLHKELNFIASLQPTSIWVGHVLEDAQNYALSEREINWLKNDEALSTTVEADIAITLTEPTPDIATHKPDGSLSQSGVVLSDMRHKLLLKLGALNRRFREPEQLCTDMIDAFNWFHAIRGGKDLHIDDFKVIDNVIRNGKNYKKWRIISKLFLVGRSTQSGHFGYINWRSLWSDYYPITIAAPSKEVVAEFHGHIESLVKANLIGQSLTMEQAYGIYILNYNLSRRIFG